MKSDSTSWRPTPYMRRAQRLFVDLLGGGEEWGCRAMPQIIRGGVRADRSHSYVFAAHALTSEQRHAMAAFANSKPIDVIAAEIGRAATDPVRLSVALRYWGEGLEFRDYRLWRLDSLAALVPDLDGFTIILKRGNLVVSRARPWGSDHEKVRGIVDGARLARETIWSD